jgi:DNA-binding CsgD family transcriptional regulator
MRLGNREYDRVLQCIREIASLGDLKTFGIGAAQAVRRMIACVNASYNEIDLCGNSLWYVTDAPGPEYAEASAILARYIHQHPVVNHYEQTRAFGAFKFSDFISAARYHRLELYNEYYRRASIEHQICARSQSSPAIVVGVALNRDVRDFSESERLMLNLVSPHLAQARSNADARSRTLEHAELIEEAIDASSVGLIVIGADSEVKLATRAAIRLLDDYFASVAIDHGLPEVLAQWVRMRRDEIRAESIPGVQPPLVIDRHDRRLVIRMCWEPCRTVLVLEERTSRIDPSALRSLGLSPREAEVLAWAAEGKTNADLAVILDARPATIAKHLERIYEKLGVETRGAAAAIAHRHVSAMRGSP